MLKVKLFRHVYIWHIIMSIVHNSNIHDEYLRILMVGI